MVNTIKNGDVEGIATTGFFLCIVPVFLIVGLPLSLTTRIKIRNKMLIFPILFSAAMFGLVPIANAA